MRRGPPHRSPDRRTYWALLLTCALSGLVSGCATPPSHTIRELGLPVFEPQLGADARFVRAGDGRGPQQGIDAWPAGSDPADEHRAFLSVVPSGTEDTVLLAVGVAGNPGAPPLSRLVVACYPVREDEAWDFHRTGRLPAPDAPPLASANLDAPDPDGVLRLLLRLPRADVPAGAERLAFPILFQFADGWIHVAWYQSIVPAPVPLPAEDAPPEEQPNKE